MSRYVNDGSTNVPDLLLYLNLATLDDLRRGSVWPGLTGKARYERLAADGFHGVQCVDATHLPPDVPLRHCGSDRINTPSEADPIVGTHAANGHDCLTVHAGWGLENDDDVFGLVEAILAASERYGIPVFIETHRATITQDMWRTVQIAKRFPEMRFNGDFSHYYTGQELVYGGMEMKCTFLEPIFARIGFMHGRIGSPGCMQVSIGDGEERPPAAHGAVSFLDDFKELWTRAMLGFLRNAGPGDRLIFCPELLPGTHYYARLIPDAIGKLVEESDRYQQALLYLKLARACFAEARRRLAAPPSPGGATLKDPFSSVAQPTRVNQVDALKTTPPEPPKKDYRIGVLGSGFIVSDCHLVSYRKAGFNPVAIASRTRDNAAKVAERHAISRVYKTYDQLLDDPSIEVLDIAVPPQNQLDLIAAACRRRTVKGILAQKPLGLNYAQAKDAVELCEAAGITLAVNQNMRYDQSVRAAKSLLDAGTLGEPVFATIDMRGIPHLMPWQEELGWVTLRIMSIHHLDCLRYWFGDPRRIFCSTRSDPRTPFPHTDGICTYILEYDSDLRCVGIDDIWTGPAREGCPSDIAIRWRIEGTAGLAMGDIGWCKDPYTSPSKLRYACKGDVSFTTPSYPGSWFPDAFAGTMGQLLIALATGQTPAIGGRDNLKTMALVDAAYRSASEHRAVDLTEVHK